MNEAHRMAMQQAVSIGRTTQRSIRNDSFVVTCVYDTSCSAVAAVFAELRAQGRLQLQAADEQVLLQVVAGARLKFFCLQGVV